MPGLEDRNFNKSFQQYKQEAGIRSDTGELLEGLWSEEQLRAVTDFEQKYPGIRDEFSRLIEMLPDPNNPEKTEFPFAASVVRMNDQGKLEVLARSLNRVNEHNDSTQHAELAALQEAQRAANSKHLDGSMLLTTAQPCEMCAGAVRNTNVNTVVYAVSQDELKGMHVEFDGGYKPIRTVPEGVDIDAQLRAAGINVVAGYQHDETLKKLKRLVGTTTELYIDPDSTLS